MPSTLCIPGLKAGVFCARFLVKNVAMQKTEILETLDKVRIDKWLWAARFFKTRALAVDEINKGRVWVNDAAAKPAREVKPGDTVRFRQGSAPPRTVAVLGISRHRGPAPVAQLLYAETAESLILAMESKEQHRMGIEPADTLLQGRPTKRDRRFIEKMHSQDDTAWDTRWSASIDAKT